MVAKSRPLSRARSAACAAATAWQRTDPSRGYSRAREDVLLGRIVQGVRVSLTQQDEQRDIKTSKA
jgi:hypothetical protein